MLQLVFTSLPFFFNDPAPLEIYTLSLHDALPISVEEWNAPARGQLSHQSVRQQVVQEGVVVGLAALLVGDAFLHNLLPRSEEHTSELQSRVDLVCRLLLEKKK